VVGKHCKEGSHLVFRAREGVVMVVVMC
jgi:hypothetical protein